MEVGRPTTRRIGWGLIALVVFLSAETLFVGLAVWDIGRFSALSANIPTSPSIDAAQLETARLGGWMLLVTVFQLCVATLGFWYVARTLRANEAAVKVATRALEVQQLASADQHRAYVHAAAAEIEWNGVLGQCRVQFTFMNTGQTPATFFEFGASFVEVPLGSLAREQPISEPASFTRWSPIGSGDRVTAAWNESRLGARLSAYSSSSETGGVILITGVVRYGTIFGETYETDFAFFIRRRPKADGTPAKLSRSTNAFRAYSLVAKEPATLPATLS